MKTRVATFPLRLPISLKAEIQELAERDGTSLNQFLAAAEKLSFMYAEEYFASMREEAGDGEFMRILKREGGVPPEPSATR